jgi:ABC-type Fe3+/spermidine/putrescine transport system ATPase subunit
MSEKYIVTKEHSWADNLVIREQLLKKDLLKNLNLTDSKKVEGKINSIVVSANNIIKEVYNNNDIYDWEETKYVKEIALKLDSFITNNIKDRDNLINILDNTNIEDMLKPLEKGLSYKIVTWLSKVADLLAKREEHKQVQKKVANNHSSFDVWEVIARTLIPWTIAAKDKTDATYRSLKSWTYLANADSEQ